MLGQRILERLGLADLGAERLNRILSGAVMIVAILVGAFLLYRLLALIINRTLGRKSRLLGDSKRRTFAPLLRSIAKYGIGIGALVLILHELGVNYTAILAGAGVVGLAVGFGAQTLIRDFISGFFILFEGLIEVGDYIEVGDKAGTVEAVGLRTTQYRSFSGVLQTIPNGELTRFGNYNRVFTRAIVDVQLAHEQDFRAGMAQATAVAEAWAKEHPGLVLEPPEVMGLFDFGDSGVTIKVTVKVQPQKHWQVERELRCRLKAAFDQAGVEIPFPRHVVYVKQGADPRPQAADRKP
jgi:small conductance mechanosensitive channel